MPEPDAPLPEIYLQPGELYLAREPSILVTILGSCVGITFWSAALKVGALCHAVMPECPESAFEKPFEGRRYVDYCVHDLAHQFRQLGVLRSAVQVKTFGGADVLFTTGTCARPSVGRQNSEMALKVLDDEGYKVEAASLGSSFGRKIRFNTATGDVLVRLLR